MGIRITFPRPEDSPTGRSPVRVRYSIRPQPDGRSAPVLLYAHGTRELTLAAWSEYQATGAIIEADTDREWQIIKEVLR